MANNVYTAAWRHVTIVALSKYHLGFVPYDNKVREQPRSVNPACGMDSVECGTLNGVDIVPYQPCASVIWRMIKP